MFDLLTGTATKPWLSGNMLPNIKTCENGCSNFPRKFENRGTKIARVNSIPITKFIYLKLFTIIVHGVRGSL